jgi:hypothetical protein
MAATAAAPMVDEVLTQLSRRFDTMYARIGRPSIAPENAAGGVGVACGVVWKVVGYFPPGRLALLRDHPAGHPGTAITRPIRPAIQETAW